MPHERDRIVVVLAIFAFASCAVHRPARSSARAPNHAAFDRGMAMYYGFDYSEAIRGFEQAAQESPDSALPRWGIALALGPNINDREMKGRMAKASAAITRARGVARLSARESDLIGALSARYATEATFDLGALNRAYAHRMKHLAAKYPSDDVSVSCTRRV